MDNTQVSTAAYTIALAGNPNSGKTTLFNCLTGSKQYVGNWPGVTVEKKAGEIIPDKWGDSDRTELIDLPGVYSLSPYTQEEIVTREFLLNTEPDIILNIVDATNLERNLFLTTQLAELGVRMIIALNMADELKAKNITLDIPLLSKRLGVPIVPISAAKEEGIDELIRELHKACERGSAHTETEFNPFNKAQNEIIAEAEAIAAAHTETHRRWFALKLLERDAPAEKMLGTLSDGEISTLMTLRKRMGSSVKDGKSSADAARAVIAKARYGAIHAAMGGAFKHDERGPSVSDKIDAVITHRFVGIPLFLAVIFLIFTVTFGRIGSTLQDIVASFIDNVVAAGIENALVAAGASDGVISLIIDGAISGVGAVLSFVPQIMLLFFFLSFLEDCGYMARVAFAMDVFLRRIGLSGKAFIPMILGFGCTVPAVMAARTLERENDRKLTIMLVPFISCSARAPLYGIFISAFFPAYRSLIMLGVYVFGIAVALLVGLILKKTVYKSDSVPFVMELPAYRMPRPKSLLLSVWDKSKGFIVKAGTVIFAASVVIWFLQNYSFSFVAVADPADSMIAAIGRFIAPIFAPMGFADWRASAALLTGLSAKEAVVSTLEILYRAGDNLNEILAANFTAASALAYMTFVLLYTPCVAALAAIKKELGKWRLTFGAMAMQISVAYIFSLAVYLVASAF